MGRSLFWPVFFKKNIIKFDLKFLERFASPKPTGKYPQGASPVQIDTLKKALAAIANETEIAIPEGMMIEYLEAASSGTVDAYERSLRYWDEQISECVLGETGTTNQSGGGGSRARDQVGNEVRLETSKAIADSLSCTFNRLARWIAAYNFPDAAPPTIYRDFGTAEDLNTRSTRDKTLFDLGYRLNAETVASVYGEGYVEAVAPDKPALIATLGVQGVSALTAILAQAESGQLPKENAIAVLVTVFGIEKKDAAAMVPEPPEQPTQQGGGLADLFGGQDQGQQDQNQQNQQPQDQQDAAFAETEPDAAGQIATKARPLIQDAVAPWLTTIQNFVKQASSLEEIRDGLIHLYPELDDADFAEAMGQAMLLADLAGREEVLGDDADVAFAEAIEAAVNGTLDFAAKKASGKKPNCNPAKSHFCQTPTGKGSCVPLSKICKYSPAGVQKTAATYTVPKATVAKKKNSKAPAAPAAAAPAAPAAPAPAATLPTNQTALDNTRADLVKRFGQKTVEQAEANTKKVLDDADLFIRVGNVTTLETILESEFKNSFQLGQDTHDIPNLKDTSYLTARARVEEKTLGIAANTPDNERPIYGYLGSQDLNGASHAGPEKAYGAIAVKLKPQAKDRATFTGADSFKSGFASQAKTDGDPPPPNAASLIAATRHGYDRDKLPRHYPSYYADDSNDGSFLKAAARANSVDDLAPRLAPTGNAYIEAQIHGGLKPSDIAELHFGLGGVTTRPNAAIALFAKANNIDVYFNDKKLDAQDLDDLITRGSTDPRSQRVRDMQTALNAGDFNASRQLTQSFVQDSDKIRQKMQPGEYDSHLKLLYAETGFDEFPKVGNEADLTQAWQDGGHLMARGVNKDGKDGLNHLRSFQTGDYFVGNGMYGNGTYVGHAGTISLSGQVTGYNSKTAKKDALRAVKDVAKHRYISKNNVTLRMVLDKDATVVTQSDLSVQRRTIAKAMEASYKTERQKLIPRGTQKFTTADEFYYKIEQKNFQSKFTNSKITTTVKSKTDVNGGITEEQVWEAIGSDGTKIQRTVKVYTPGPIVVAQGATTFAWVDGPNRSKYYFHISPQGKPTAHAMIELASFEAGPAVLAEKGWSVEPKRGQYNLSPSDAAKITVIDNDYQDIVKVMGLDSDDDGSIGRFAVLQGVDAIALDLSYEPKTFMNLLNRSKVTLQKDPIDWATAKKTGAF